MVTTHLRQTWAAIIESGARGDLPKGMTFKYKKGTMSGDNNAFDAVEAFVGGERVGIIEWWNRDVESGSRGDFGQGMIRWIDVTKEWRRRGIATALFEDAKKRVSYRIYHSYDLSDTGRPWAKDVGGQIGWDHMQPGYVDPNAAFYERARLERERKDRERGWVPRAASLGSTSKQAAISYNPETELPRNKPGTQSVPSGAVRAFHYTWPRNLGSIMRGGLKGSHAQQIDYDGEGIWAAAGVPQGIKDCLAGRESGRIWIEFWTPVDTLYIGGGAGISASWLEQRNAHIVCPDVPVARFLGVYLPWHFAYWHMKDDPRMYKDVMEGMHDNLITDPEHKDSYGKAIQRIKAGR